jgi:hypothetical protein
MIWRKLGRIFAEPSGVEWAVSHAAVPVVRNNGERVYCTTRDARGRGHVGFFDLRWEGGQPRASALARCPALSPGALGTFDDSGVTTSCMIEQDGLLYLYYTGWSLGVTVPFYLATGLAVSEDGGETFIRVSDAPLLPNVSGEAYLNASPWVLRDGGMYRMWYTAGTRWETIGTVLRHWYHIRYAESDDGLSWRRQGVVAVDYASNEEFALSRPCVVKDGDLYRMWFAARGDAYRLAYAESRDGIAWTRNDAAVGMNVSPSGWDAEMLAYPLVFDRGGQRYMLYNGNDFGRTGIGAALLESGEQRHQAFHRRTGELVVS